jgi:type IV pilus assembly protein PilB
MKTNDKKLLDLLVKDNVILLDEAKEIAEMIDKGGSIKNIIENRKILDSEKMVKYRAKVAGMPYESLVDKKVDSKILEIIPPKVSENYNIICFEQEGNVIKVGIVDPYNSKAVEAVNFLAQSKKVTPEYYLISEESFNNFFKQYRNLKDEVSSALDVDSEESAGGISLNDDDEIQSVHAEDDVDAAPVAKIVSVIIRHAVEGKASDIHIEPLEQETRVRYRIDGILKTSLTLPKRVHNSIVGRIKVLARLKIDETRIPQDGRIRLIVDTKKIDFRVSVMPLRGSEKIVMRILDLGKGIPELEDLGYEHRTLDVIKKNIKKTYGLLLVTGPTGSGKSTTLASILTLLNKDQVNISTLEDPIEYNVKGVNQSQVKPAIGYTFASGLRSLLRQDPDILMVGEIRDTETAELCIHAGLTGHFVISTLHTNNTIDAVPRLLDMKVEPYLLGSTLNTIVAQRLVRKICSKCKKKIKISENFLERMHEELKDVPDKILKERVDSFTSKDDFKSLSFYKGEGCAHCGGTGYKGRTAVVEIIDVTNQIKQKIIDKDYFLKIKDVKEDQDFINMKQDGMIKAMQGKTTIEEVLRVAEN